jgi:hypothetical protein
MYAGAVGITIDEARRALTENVALKKQLAAETLANEKLRRTVSTLQQRIRTAKLNNAKSTVNAFTVDSVNGSRIKNLFAYYTGFSFATFLLLFSVLVPANSELPFHHKNYRCFGHLSLQDQLFFVLCKLRNGLHFKDLAFRFKISPQNASILFRSWINYIYFTFASVSMWPPREIIQQHMPDKFKRDFPNAIAIIDSTEIRIQRPSALKAQSQCWSEYKSSPTLKGLVAVDPRGSILFVSSLFTGSISDNQLVIDSGFLLTLSRLLDAGRLDIGDEIMSDKGFTCSKEFENLGLHLIVPPFAVGGDQQMPASDVTLTKNIAAHRVHVERAIGRIKNFKILSQRVDISFLTCIDQIWSVCAFLTNFMPALVAK